MILTNDIIAQKPIVDVRAYGAKGDGVTNDTEAIKAAINAAENGVLLIPAGTYVVNEFVSGEKVKNVIDLGMYANIRPFFTEDTRFGSLENCSYIQGMNDDFIPSTYNGDTISMQGFTYDSTRKRLIVAAVKDYDYQLLYPVTPTFDNNGIIESLSTGTPIQHTDLYHCNSLAYCDVTDKVYVLLNGGGSDGMHVAVLNPSTLETESTIEFTHKSAHIAYDKTNKVFVLSHYVPSGGIDTYRIYDVNFNLLKTLTIDTSNIDDGRNSICCDKGVVVGATLREIFSVDLFGHIKSVNSFAQSTGEMWEPEDFEIINGHIYFNTVFINKYTFWLNDKDFSVVKDDVSVNPLRYVKPKKDHVPVFLTNGSATRVDYLTLLSLLGLGNFSGGVIPEDADWDNLKGIYTARGDGGFSDTNSHYPANSYRYGVLLSLQGVNNTGLQIFMEQPTSGREVSIYFRQKYWTKTNWEAWRKITTSAL